MILGLMCAARAQTVNAYTYIYIYQIMGYYKIQQQQHPPASPAPESGWLTSTVRGLSLLELIIFFLVLVLFNYYVYV